MADKNLKKQFELKENYYQGVFDDADLNSKPKFSKFKIAS